MKMLQESCTSKGDTLLCKLCHKSLSLSFCSGRKNKINFPQNMHEKIKCSWICVRMLQNNRYVHILKDIHSFALLQYSIEPWINCDPNINPEIP